LCWLTYCNGFVPAYSIVETDDDDEDDDVPEVPLEELLNALALGSEPKLPQPACPEGDDDDDDDEDMSD
jgi:hypothetical protein